jgi:hypothetical protein
MGWLVRVPGFEFDTDDMTIAELGRVEKLSETPWSIANPFREVAVAKAFYTVALERSGMEKKDVDVTIFGLTLKDLRNAFEFVAQEGEVTSAEEADPSDPPSPSTSPESSPGPRGKAGRPAKRS